MQVARDKLHKYFAAAKEQVLFFFFIQLARGEVQELVAAKEQVLNLFALLVALQAGLLAKAKLDAENTQLTCFTRTHVQILTQKALQAGLLAKAKLDAENMLQARLYCL